MKIKYMSPDFEIIDLTLQWDVLGASNPEYSTPEEGDDLPRTSSLDDDDDGLFG